jgi:hypothetical protein
MGSIPMATRPTAVTSERRLRESSHGEIAEGDGAIPRRDSERIAMEYSHGDTASVQRMAREPSNGETAGG